MMNEQELKKVAIQHAINLQYVLEQIDDDQFIDKIINCVANNSYIDEDELLNYD